MVEYSKVNIKLTDTQLKKLKTAVKNKTGRTLKMSLKMLDGNDLPHELLLTTRQKVKLTNVFNNNMGTDITLFRMWGGGGGGRCRGKSPPPNHFSPCNFCKRKKWPSKFFDF